MGRMAAVADTQQSFMSWAQPLVSDHDDDDNDNRLTALQYHFPSTIISSGLGIPHLVPINQSMNQRRYPSESARPVCRLLGLQRCLLAEPGCATIAYILTG